jgi:uncharacterized cupredoxin-like copper-binding protein
MEHVHLFRNLLTVSALVLAVTAPSTYAFAQGAHGGAHGGGQMSPGENMPSGGGHMKPGEHMMPGMTPGTMQGTIPGTGHGAGAGHGPSNAAGEPGKESEVSRTVTIDMTDNRYSIEEITVKAGETIRFVISNKGRLVHEFNIGTPDMHKGHQKEMMMMVDHGVLEADRINHARMKMDMGGGRTMEHNDPNSILLEPGKSKAIVWTFSNAGTFEFACNVPGHYDAGMVGEVEVK